jgi:hypothetical protein
MDNAYFHEARKIIEKLARDEELMLEERLILLKLVEGYIAKVTEDLEDELAKGKAGQDG